MRSTSFIETVDKILQDDPRYSADAYQFVREALDFTIAASGKHNVERHVSGGELLEGIRKYALQEFGPIAFTVLLSWGIRGCEDFGQIVFNLVNEGLLRKNEKDSIHDFEGGYDFDTAFRKPFRPESTLEEKPSGSIEENG